MYGIRKCPKCGRYLVGHIEYAYGNPKISYFCDYCCCTPIWKVTYSDRTKSFEGGQGNDSWRTDQKTE